MSGEQVYRIDVTITAYCDDDGDADRLAGALADFADQDERCGEFECWVAPRGGVPPSGKERP